MRRFLLLAAVLPPLAFSRGAAQTLPLTPGDRVRIESEDVSGEFDVLEVRSDTLVLRPDSDVTSVSVPIVSVTALERGQGRYGRRGLLIGCGIGGALGLASEYGAEAAPAFCLTLGGIGYLLGLLFYNWEEIPLPAQLSILPSKDRGVALGYSVSF